MWEGDQSRAVGAEKASACALAPGRGVKPAHALHIVGGEAASRATPVKPELVTFTADAPADVAFEAVLAQYARGISQNLRCVQSESDPEGAHQLRVTLRRLRSALKIFKPVIRGAVNKRLAWMSRYIGAIVGELRDADVMIEEILRPAATPDTPALGLIDLWREDIRAKVRESLQAARASAFANDLLLLAQTHEWRRADAKRAGRGAPARARDLIDETIAALETKAGERGVRAQLLTPTERHDFRKDIKALRYAVELSAAYAQDAPARLILLKRLQIVLGQLNDMHMFRLFEPALPKQRDAYAAWRTQLIEKHAERTPRLVAATAARWRAIAMTA